MKRLALLSLACALALAGCGGLKKGGYTAVGVEKDSAVPKTVQKDAQVTMDEIRFHPRIISLRRGGKITWTNRDQVAHTVTVGSELYNTVNSGEVKPGKRYSHVFDKAGEVSYRCTIHPNMVGTIFVRK